MEEERAGRRTGPLIAAIILGIAAVFAGFYLRPFRAFPEKGLLDSGPTVLVENGQSGLVFMPKAAPRRVGLIICGAARVPPESYAYLARSAAVSGYTAIVLKAPLNLIQLSGSSALRRVETAFPNVKTWVLAGHEKGGEWAASQIAEKNGDFSGLILMNASPSENLSALKLSVLFLYSESQNGKEAGQSSRQRAETALLLPANNTRFVAISNGSLSGFGEYETDADAHLRKQAEASARYGIQKSAENGQAVPALPAVAQRRAAVEETIAFLNGIAGI